MSTPTDLHPASPSTVLTHPAFDRPPVHNERRRGRKKGTRSLAAARRDREQVRAATERAALRSVAAPEPWQSRATAPPPRDPLAPPRPRHEDAVIGAALAIIEDRMRVQAWAFEQPHAVKDYLRLHLAGLDRESFGVMFLDVQHG